jgi:ribonuclease HI
MASKGKKYYVVWKGHEPGIYQSWDECRKQIQGFEGAAYKSFKTEELAKKAFNGLPDDYIGMDTRREERTDTERIKYGEPVLKSLSVDAACSGNPGILEYRGVMTRTGREIFRQGPFDHGTVNIGEFLALVHGLAYLKKEGKDIPVYSDSRTAIKWIRDKKVKTRLEKTARNKKLFELIDRAELWLQNNTYPNKILKWETHVWGEIPADFGRK